MRSHLVAYLTGTIKPLLCAPKLPREFRTDEDWAKFFLFVIYLLLRTQNINLFSCRVICGSHQRQLDMFKECSKDQKASQMDPIKTLLLAMSSLWYKGFKKQEQSFIKVS